MKGQSYRMIEEAETLSHALEFVSVWTVAIDGGANVGVWTVKMSQHFDRTIAFEPGAEAFAALKVNAVGNRGIELRNQALMDVPGRVNVERPRPGRGKLTSRVCVKAEDGTVEAVTIDGLKLASCGLIKLDLEGAEILALNGGSRTILRLKPVMIVETWRDQAGRFGHAPEAAHSRLLGWGYREVYRANADRVYVA